jgi:rSAM/selenodomain-associated transferase 1
MSAPELDPAAVTLIVIAKEPLPGRAKTRLAPALGADGAAEVAAAALADTLAAVAASAAATGRKVLLALDGDVGPWLPPSPPAPAIRVTPQRGDGLGERLAAAFADAAGPAFLVGMDTPQIDPATIDAGVAALCAAGTDAVLGLAVDGGYWAIGLREPDDRVFAGVPMSAGDTGALQLEALAAAGLAVAELPMLVDVDEIDDAERVAAAAPGSRFAAALARHRIAGVSDE